MRPNRRGSPTETVSEIFDAVRLTITMGKTTGPNFRFFGQPEDVSLERREQAADFAKRYFAMTHEACYLMLWDRVPRSKRVERLAGEAETKLPEMRRRVKARMLCRS